jgi:hypothetical protein
MLDIFFTNKIPSTNDTWTDELIQVATIFDEFDGLPYSRADITNRFEVISNRWPEARDNSDYRDQYGAYASYLGLINFEKDADHNRLICRVNPRAKNLLCGILPDPEAYMRLQMALFQYPNPIGSLAYENGTIRPEPLSLAKRIEMVRNGVRTVPFRLLLKVLIALAERYSPDDAYLSYPEIWACLFTQDKAICTLEPDAVELADDIINFRAGNPGTIQIPSNALRNLHILKHTGLINYRGAHRAAHRRIALEVEAFDSGTQLGQIARSIAALNLFFPVPPQNSADAEIREWSRHSLESGEWAEYYSGDFLSLETASEILQSVAPIAGDADLFNANEPGIGAELVELQSSWHERNLRAQRRVGRRASPEETEVLRERANLKHRELMKLIADRIRTLDEIPYFNQYIDIATSAPGHERLFEIKSCRPENILAQIRKGVSQLYEYRYRHQDLAAAKLILVLEERPQNDLAWLIDYLTRDRQIDLCWLEGDETLAAPNACEPSLGRIVHHYEP